jgi:2,4-dienoyl-CoA reductase-like NADH-dependent reductase (Old Yellow Enzyme family)
LSVAEIGEIVQAFAAAAQRALAAGFDFVEIHGAHGYLIHEFLSPLSNKRQDSYGGTFDNRVRFAIEVADGVRRVWPERLPLFTRLSCTDWVEDGWTIDDSVELSRRLHSSGVDLIDCSSGGAVPWAKISAVPGYQVPFASRIRREAQVLTAAVGMISEPEQAAGIIESGHADLVLLAREFLRHPYWPLNAAAAFGVETNVPVQYQRAYPKPRPM